MCRCQSRQERTSEWSKPICPVASVKVSSIVQRVPAARPTSVSGVPLTNLYNARPTWLDLAHKRLDAAVFDAYGWPHDLTDDQVLERLLALNLERAPA